MSKASVDRIGGTHPTQTSQGEMVVENQSFLRIVETLYILTRLGVVGTPVDVLHHMKILRNVFEMIVLVSVQHLVHEVNIPEVPRRSRLVLHLERGLDDLLHHVGPVVVLDGRYNFVDVEQGDVVVSRIENNQARSSCDSSIGVVVYFMPLLCC